MDAHWKKNTVTLVVQALPECMKNAASNTKKHLNASNSGITAKQHDVNETYVSMGKYGTSLRRNIFDESHNALKSKPHK